MFHLHELEFYIRSPKYSVDQRALHTTVIYELKYPIQGVQVESLLVRMRLINGYTVCAIFHRHTSYFLHLCIKSFLGVGGNTLSSVAHVVKKEVM